MDLYSLAQKLIGFRRYWILLVIVLGVVFGLLGDKILRPVAQTCSAPPQYNADVPASVRNEIDTLYAQGLLYCGDTRDQITVLHQPVYWGSDGVNSVLFFQADDLAGVGVTRYAFGQRYLPGPPGDGPAPGAKPLVPGEAVTRNQAPPGSSYFYRVDGAPADDDYDVEVEIAGPARENQGLTGRNFWRDLDRFLAAVRQRSLPTGPRKTYVKIAQPILPDRWLAVRKREVNPQLTDRPGHLSLKALQTVNPVQPMLYQTVNGPSGSTVWVAGVISGTQPALVIAPSSGGKEVEPTSSMLWQGQLKNLLLSATFPPQSSAGQYEVRYWNDGKSRNTQSPDYTWQATFTDWHGPPAP